MASMRKLNRRLLRWRRYAFRTYWNPRHTPPRWTWSRSAVLCSPGHTRAWDRREREVERRFWDETPEIWLGGPEGEAALIADVLGDEPEHDPLCVDQPGHPHDNECECRCHGCPTCCSQSRVGELSGRLGVDHGDGPEWCDDEWHDADCDDTGGLYDDSLPPDADYAWRDGRAVRVETETALTEAGLL